MMAVRGLLRRDGVKMDDGQLGLMGVIMNFLNKYKDPWCLLASFSCRLGSRRGVSVEPSRLDRRSWTSHE
jgi:hypothetical protein